VAPALVLVSQRHLNASADAFEGGDCVRAMSEASRSIQTLAIRPEPYEALGYCQAHRGQPSLAPAALRKAVSYDPENWEYRYGLALVEGAAGRDPLPYARAAARFNPRDQITKGLVYGLSRSSPRERVKIAAALARTERLSVVR
jgi:Flp pilus assembly protein TadD